MLFVVDDLTLGTLFFVGMAVGLAWGAFASRAVGPAPRWVICLLLFAVVVQWAFMYCHNHGILQHCVTKIPLRAT